MLQLKEELLKSTTPWKVGVVRSDTLVDGKRSSNGQERGSAWRSCSQSWTETPLPVSRLCWGACLHRGCDGQEQTWGSHSTRGDAGAVERRPRRLVAEEGCFRQALVFVRTQLEDE